MNAHKLAAGDTIQIQYRCWRHSQDGSSLADRWVRAVIVAAVPGERPLAELADGQLTEVRAYMPWRLVAKGAVAPTERMRALASAIGLGERASRAA